MIKQLIIHLELDIFKFKRVPNLKYLQIDINKMAKSYKIIEQKIMTV